ncbi:hypothetical protein APHAL10511_001760 [Amanita phalloides]|nr:hypothetical protein APHAL10511_001760 [Amanita phalloides]
MPTSELSNALNPYVTQERPRQPVAEYPAPLPQAASTPQHYAPHRSELELAVSEPQPPVPPPSRHFSQEGVNAVQEFIRLVTTTREAQEIERKRRLAWEQEQEAKQTQRQAETERCILEMRQEIQSLRAMLNRNGRATIPQTSSQALQPAPAQPTPQQPIALTNGLFTPHYTLSPAVPEQSIPQHPPTPMASTSINQLNSMSQSAFVQGSSSKTYTPNARSSPAELCFTQETQQHISYHGQTGQLQLISPVQPQPQHIYQAGVGNQQPRSTSNQIGSLQQPAGPAAQSVTPSPSPQLSVLHPPTYLSKMKRKRKTPDVTNDDDDDDDDDGGSDGSDGAPVQRIRRTNHHDKRCLTIQHAMRLHFLCSMELDTDKDLPDSHVEGAALEDTQPVRFVWDKTTKQSVHNLRMKSRILSDMKVKRTVYKHVPDREFGKKSLDSAFEQCFTTFRQKFRAQRDAVVATNLKQREDQKARKARHLSRRKLKLSNRAEARQKLATFEHVIFDGALQLDCMSSEESEDESGNESSKTNGPLRTRGYAWRSTRLIQFYCILDDEERVEKSAKPKRGIGKRDRCTGPPKDGFHLPPKGVATWMVSRKWIGAAQRGLPDLPETLSKLIVDPPGFDWEHFEALGMESGEEMQDRHKAREFVDLHDQVQTSVSLLDSLESFLSTFQKDLQAVSGQISELQDRSKDIEGRLKSRRRIERPLSSLISDITLPPQLTTTILDTEVGEPWISTVGDFERRLVMIKSRARVKGARDLAEVAEGLRIVAATKLRAYFMALFQPIRRSVTTNMQVMQTSVLLKYSPLFAFLQRQASNVAQELQRSYIGAARVYYETGFRRYARSLGYIKARTNEKFDLITSTELTEAQVKFDRLVYAKLDGPAVTLSFMADDKTYKEPVEALLRSLFLVFMDNSTAEYTFVRSFFSDQQFVPPSDIQTSIPYAMTPLSPERLSFEDDKMISGSEMGDNPDRAIVLTAPSLKKEHVNIDLIWKQIMEPVLEYCQTFVNTVLEAVPSVTSLLTMIRLIEEVVIEIQRRQCPPVETYVFTIRLQMWPVFQRLMTDHIDALKKLAEGSSTSYFSRAQSTTEALVTSICSRYTIVFNSFIHLTIHEEETMIFSNLLRLRQELTKLITRHTNQITDGVSRATKQAWIYQFLLQGLSKELTAHPKLQQEIAYWSNLEEEVTRKIVSMGQSRARR